MWFSIKKKPNKPLIKQVDLNQIEYIQREQYSGVINFFISEVPTNSGVFDDYICHFHDSLTSIVGIDTFLYYDIYRESDITNISYLKSNPREFFDLSESQDLCFQYKHVKGKCKLYKKTHLANTFSSDKLECEFCKEND